MRYCNYQKDLFQFQFHLVRLKVPVVSDSIYYQVFQFHLVRLKEGVIQPVKLGKLISIPFSTIKRT